MGFIVLLNIVGLFFLLVFSYGVYLMIGLYMSRKSNKIEKEIEMLKQKMKEMD